MMTSAVTDRQKAVTQLAIGAFFFACRSCEYLKVGAAEHKRTKILKIGNIKFQRTGNLVTQTSNDLHLADNVTLTFEYQKNESKNESVMQWKTNHASKCPVKQWAAIVKRIQKYPGATACDKNEHNNNIIMQREHHDKILHRKESNTTTK